MLTRSLNQCTLLYKRAVALPAVQRLSTQTDDKPKDAAEAHAVSWANARPFEKMPGPSQLEVVRGFLPGGKYYKKPITDMIKIFSQKYGEIFRFPSIFGKPSFIIDMNPEDYPVIFRNEGPWPKRRVFESVAYYREVYRRDFFQGVEGIISTNGEKWAKMRTLVNPILMQPKHAQLYLNSLLDVNDEFLLRVREIRDPQTHEMPADFLDEINRLAFEGIAVVALNTKLGVIRKNRDSAECKTALHSLRRFADLSESLEIKPSIWKIVKTPEFYEMMNVLDTLTNICKKYSSEALKRIEHDPAGRPASEVGKEKSVLEKLARVDKKFAVVMALDMLTAGVDTTSSTLVGILLCIAKNPEKQQKLFEELKEILPAKNSSLNLQNMQHLPYLRACIKEGIRMYPIIPGTMRNLSSDVVLSGYRVPAGNDITIASNMLMQDERYVPLAKEFIPERWLRNDSSSKGLEGQISNPFMYLPFGFGPRSCAGKRIVNIELEITIARLIRNFNIEFNYPTDKAFSSKFINVPSVPLKFKFEERQL